MTDRGKSLTVLTMNTLAFTVCFAAWMMNGVLVTYLVENGVFAFTKSQMGWLIGIPVLTGSLLRLPVGVLTDRYGGRIVYVLVMLLSAVAAFLVSFADGFWSFALGGLGFGIAGASFAVGIAYTSVWFTKERQGTALGIFGMGNTGAALTSLFAPKLLDALTRHGAQLDAWRQLPRLYAVLLAAMGLIFWLFTYPKRAAAAEKTLGQRLAPLRVLRVWRFGLYYLLVFGGFVALAQWLIPYYVNVYSVTVATAGTLAAIFSLPSGLFRAVGGWLSDRYGARLVMYWVLSGCVVCMLLLSVPRMDLQSPGEGVMATAAGEVTAVAADHLEVGGKSYPLRARTESVPRDEQMLVWPQSDFWQEPVVKPGDLVTKRQLLARGITHIFFQANRSIFTGILFVLAIFMGIGMAAVYKHIPTYFPANVGVVGGIVGVLGGLGGFFFPILFGYLLQLSGIWTTCWLFFCGLSAVSLVWMHLVIQRVMAETAPQFARDMETPVLTREMEQIAAEMEILAQKLRRRSGAA